MTRRRREKYSGFTVQVDREGVEDVTDYGRVRQRAHRA